MPCCTRLPPQTQESGFCCAGVSICSRLSSTDRRTESTSRPPHSVEVRPSSPAPRVCVKAEWVQVQGLYGESYAHVLGRA
jgi:hypothetical protein